jgi:signal transduction histidine kinase
MPLKGRADHLADWLLAAILAGSAQYEVWTTAGSFGQRAGGAIFLLAATVPLAWRRDAPLAVVVTISVALLGGGVLFDGYQASFQGFLASIVALYTVAAYGEQRERIIGAAAVAVGLAGFQLAEVLRGNDIGELPGVWLPFLIAFALGRVRGWQLSESKHLRRRAAELERERDEKARLAVQEERARIARELHDIVAHAISIMIVQARVGRRRLAGEPELPRESFDTIEDTGRQALTEMRRLVGMLRAEGEQPALDSHPGLGQLDELVAQVSKAGLAVELTIEGEPRELPPGIDLSSYRIVQEALTNALKHAGQATARVVVRYSDDEIDIAVTDTGANTEEGGPGGHGLAGMRERVSLYGGQIEAGHQAGGGFIVRARLPLGWAPT